MSDKAVTSSGLGPWPRLAQGMLTALLLAGIGCATAVKGPFMWVDQLTEVEPAVPAGEYIIGPGDALNVQVWEQEKMSARTRVRSDGNISLPFVNDVPAAGKTPVALARNLEELFKNFIVTPNVTVAVDEAMPLQISVLGEVVEPGLKDLASGAGVAQAIAAAGGLKEFAHKDRIFVLRHDTVPVLRLRMTYEALTSGLGRAAGLRLRGGDVVVVE